MIRIGVVGCGVIGTEHLKAAMQDPRIRIQAIADRIGERLDTAVREFSPEAAYSDGSDLIGDESVDAVVLAFPTAERTATALDAFAAGKHVLLEKQVAMHSADVRRLIEARGDLVGACCSSRFRFSARARRIRDIVESGRLGPIRMVRSRAIVPATGAPTAPKPEWRLKRELNGGGILVNWGCYDIDFLLGAFSFDLRPLTVFAQTWQIPEIFRSHVPSGSTAETYYTALIRCDGGVLISLERGEYMAAKADASWEIIGESGSVRFDMADTADDAVELVSSSAERGAECERTESSACPDFHIHAGPIVDFAESIDTGRKPATTLEEALIVQRMTDAIYESAETGRCVILERAEDS